MNVATRPVILLAWATSCSLVGVANPVRAESATDDAADRCATTAESGQAERHARRLIRAREAFRECAAEICPTVVREDCRRWMSELTDELPSLVLSAHDARGQNVTGVRVYANETLLVEQLDGRTVDVDPGRYHLRFEARSGATKEDSVVIETGEQRREFSVRFGEALEADGSAASRVTVQPSPAEAQRPKAPQSRSPQSESQPPRANTLALVFGAAGVASLGAFTYFELVGQSRYNELENGCGRTQTCPPDEVASVRTNFVLAGSFLAASVVCLGVSTWQFLRSRNAVTAARTRPGPNLVFRF